MNVLTITKYSNGLVRKVFLTFQKFEWSSTIKVKTCCCTDELRFPSKLIIRVRGIHQGGSKVWSSLEYVYLFIFDFVII